MRADIRNCATGLLRQRKHHQVLPIDEEKGLQSLRTDDSIVIVSADKGGATVVMEKSDYVNKANQVFNDREAYTPLEEDPTKKQAAPVKKKVNELTRLKLITPDDSRCMTLNDPRIAHAYGLPKVHKEGAPLRIIVPLIGSPTYNLAKWLYRHLKHLTNGSQYSIKNSQAFLQKIQGLQDNPTNIPIEHISELLRLCLKNYCKFDGKFYQQVMGTPMGSPISGLLAELVLQQLEEEVMRTFKPKMWLRYVDDTFVIMKTCEIEQLHLSLNSVFPAIQFTCEKATGGFLPFLDVSIQTLSDGGLATSAYRKDSSADVILNYESNHPAAHKRSCVRTLFHRAYRYCSSDDLRKKELAFLYRLFRLNGYPVSFVKNCLRHQRQPQGFASNEGPEYRKFYSLPYMQGISEAIARQLNRFGIFIGVVINSSKCVLSVASLEFLDHQVDSEDLRPFPSNVEAVRNFPPPTAKRQSQDCADLLSHDPPPSHPMIFHLHNAILSHLPPPPPSLSLSTPLVMAIASTFLTTLSLRYIHIAFAVCVVFRRPPV
nr:unnamed protein product [Spirometra erinaceieuropaei]